MQNQPANENKRDELFECFKSADPAKQLEALKKLSNNQQKGERNEY